MTRVGLQLNGKYKLLRLIGEGGMGAVYEAEHLLLGSRVAIKILHTDLIARPGLVDRFLQEARVSAQIKSPHVVAVSDVDRTPSGDAYMVMELLGGEALSTVLERCGHVPVATAVEYTRQILEALEAAHALHVVHRDLKPENVLVTVHGGKPLLKLIDFGIAKLRDPGAPDRNLTMVGMLMGTAEYMAPEQATAAEKVDGRADLYAASVMLFEMIAGCRPAAGEDARIVAMRVERGEIKQLLQVAPTCAPELAKLVHRGLAFRAEARFANATEMRLLLEEQQARLAQVTAPVAAMPGQAGLPSQAGQAGQAGAAPRAPADAPIVHAGAQPAAQLSAEVARGSTAPPAVHAAPQTGTELELPAVPRMDAGRNAQHAPGRAPAVHAHPGPQALQPAPPRLLPAPNAGVRRPARNGGTLLLFGALALLVGAGAVAAMVYSANNSDTSAPSVTGTLYGTVAALAPKPQPLPSTAASAGGGAGEGAGTLPVLQPADGTGNSRPAGVGGAGQGAAGQGATEPKRDAGNPEARDAGAADGGSGAAPPPFGIPGVSVTLPPWPSTVPFPPPTFPIPPGFPGFTPPNPP